MLLQKEKKKIGKRKSNYILKGNPITSEEFITLVNESDESGYLSLEEFKKKCLSLMHSK
jgi:hypothetical protein